MASITSSRGRRTLQFMAKDGKRKSIRLGKMSLKLANEIKVKIEHLEAAVRSGCSPEAEIADWLVRVGDGLAARLTAVGLLPKRGYTGLGEFLESLLAERPDMKSWRNRRSCKIRLIEFFGANKHLSEITPGDADAFCRWMGSEAVRQPRGGPPGFGLSSITTWHYAKLARQFFKAALRRRIISENPFADVKAHGLVNKDRQYFLKLTDAYKVLEACPDAEWQLIFALARFGGLRCKSEYEHLKWVDVNWALDRFWATSPKTKHQGHPGRWVPIFGELRPYLEKAFELAEPGSVYVISRRRVRSATTLCDNLLRIIKRAGLSPWPKPWQNLRSTRQTELVQQGHPEHVVCKWLGNSVKVARGHYLQVTESDFQRAAKSGAPALQNPVQQYANPSSTLPEDFAEDGPDVEVMSEQAPGCRQAKMDQQT